VRVHACMCAGDQRVRDAVDDLLSARHRRHTHLLVHTTEQMATTAGVHKLLRHNHIYRHGHVFVRGTDDGTRAPTYTRVYTRTQILPVENKLRHPEDFRHNCGVLPTTMSLATVLLTAVGFYGYTAFGDQTATTITFNLPR
jgi:hypothetical protein